MFGSKKETENSSFNNNPNLTNIIASGTHIDGKIKADSDIRIDGTLNGELDCSGRVIIGKNGSIDGNVSCVNAIIEGKFTGKLVVKESLQVLETANVVGDVFVAKLDVSAGSVFNVNCSMDGTTPKIMANSSNSIKEPINLELN